MKKFLLPFFLIISLKSFAEDQTALLDFSHLYGNLDAGVYEMKASFVSKETPSKSSLSFHQNNEGDYSTCTTFANFEIGKVKIVLRNLKNAQSYETSKTIFASAAIGVEGEQCETSLEKFHGVQSIYALTGLEKPIELLVKAPKGYDSVSVFLSVFNGYLNLQGNLSIDENMLVLDPKDLLGEKSIMSNAEHASVVYYVFAQNKTSTLSLGTGSSPLNN